MARTRQRSQQARASNTNTATGSVSQAQGQLPPFLYNNIVPTLQKIADQYITGFTQVTGLITQCQYASQFGVPLTNQMISTNPAAAAGQPRPVIELQAGSQTGAGTAAGDVAKVPTIDKLILLEMDNFPTGFTSQEMRAHLANKYGQSREKPINQNHVTNALRKHWENNRMWALGGNPLTKEAVDRWYSPTVARPAGAYSPQTLQQQPPAPQQQPLVQAS